MWPYIEPLHFTACPRCLGSGKRDGERECRLCLGTGSIRDEMLPFLCRRCAGTGIDPACTGDGRCWCGGAPGCPCDACGGAGVPRRVIK